MLEELIRNRPVDRFDPPPRTASQAKQHFAVLQEARQRRELAHISEAAVDPVVAGGRRYQPRHRGGRGREGSPVVCVEHPEWGVFASRTKAGRHIGVWRTAIVWAVQRGGTAGGLHWKVAEDQRHG